MEEKLQENLWVIQPFTNETTDNEMMIDLMADIHQKVAFQGMSYADFWVKLCNMPEYKALAERPISILVRLPCTYLCESGFSSLTQIKCQKRNRLTNIDPVMRLALETKLVPNYKLLLQQMQQQISH